MDFLITEIWTFKHNDTHTHTCIQALKLLRSYHKNQEDREKSNAEVILSVVLFEWLPEHVGLCWATQTAHSELLMKMKQNQMLEEIQTTQRVEMWNTATLRRVHLWFPIKSLSENKVYNLHALIEEGQKALFLCHSYLALRENKIRPTWPYRSKRTNKIWF